MAQIAVAQVDVTLGDVTANLAHAHEAISGAAAQGADLVVFPRAGAARIRAGTDGGRSLPAR